MTFLVLLEDVLEPVRNGGFALGRQAHHDDVELLVLDGHGTKIPSAYGQHKEFHRVEQTTKPASRRLLNPIRGGQKHLDKPRFCH